MLTFVGAGAATLGLAACASGAAGSGATAAATATASATAPTAAGEIPDETAGPSPGDGSNGVDVLERSGIVRSDLRTSIGGGATAEGVPMALSLTLLDAASGDAPVAGAAVYVWHCDANGDYSMCSSGVEEETSLRGVQVADATGTVSFTSIIPACYSGRWPHVHVEVYPDVDSITDAATAIATSQVALQEEACTAVYALAAYSGSRLSSQNLAQVSLDDDNVFGDDGGARQLATMSGNPTSGYSVALTASVDARTTPTAVPGAGRPGSR